MTEDPYRDPYNYGRPDPGDTLGREERRTTGGAVQQPRSSELSPQDERTWGTLVNLSIFVNLLTGIFGPVASFAVWLVYKDRSEEVRFQALQSLWYQVSWLVVMSVGWTVTAILTAFVIGILLWPVMIALSVLPFVHSAYGAYRVYQGHEFRVPIIAGMLDR